MIHILDASFRYEPSFDTDVRRTFERIRRQLAQAKPIAEGRVTVLQLDQLKKKAAALPPAAARSAS